MNTPVTAAVIPAFLRFRVEPTELNFGPVHGYTADLERGLGAALISMASQRLASEKASLDRCDGTLSISSNHDGDGDWRGHIARHRAGTDGVGGGYRDGDYSVRIDVKPPAFDQLIAMLGTGQTPFALSLDFQNIDLPAGAEPLDDRLWDDVRYPCVALSSFLLRMKPVSGAPLAGYLWP